MDFLHTYIVEEVSWSIKLLNVEIKLKFNLLQGCKNSKLEGHLFRRIVSLTESDSVMYIKHFT